MPTLEVYTTGGGYNIYSILNFLAMFSSGNQFMDMMQIGTAFGLIYLLVKIVMTGNMQGTLQYLVILAVIGALSFGAKARVVVMDTTYPLEIYGTVDNVPLSVALVSSLPSRTSYELTRQMEALLSKPDNLTYQKHGMLFGASIMAQATRWRAVTPSIHNNLVSFMENCMINGTNIGLVDINTLTKAGDLSSYIANNAPGALAYFDETTETTNGCSTGWPGLEAQINQEVIKIISKKAHALSDRGGNNPNIVDINGLTGTLDDFQSMMGMAGYNASSYIKQSMLVMAMDDSLQRQIANSGNSASMALYQAARSKAQTTSSYQAAGISALQFVPTLKVAFEILYFGAFPIALLLMMTPMAIIVIRGYFGGFVWLASWEPLSAILHTVLLDNSTGFYREHTTTLSGTSAQDVLNWANHVGIQSVEQQIGAQAGFMMSSIPFLATIIFFGASKMGGMATSMLNVSQGASIDTGREAATGNLALSNMSFNNMAANKHNVASVVDHGRFTETLKDGSLITTNADGSQTLQRGSALSNTGFGATIGHALRAEHGERLSEANRAVSSSTSSLSNGISSTSAQLSDFAKTASQQMSAGGEWSTTFGTSEKRAFDQSWSEIQKVAKENGISTDVALSAMISGGLAGQAGVRGEMGIPKWVPTNAQGEAGANLSLALQASGNLSASSREGFQRVFNAAKQGNYSETVSALRDTAERAYNNDTSSEGISASNSLRTSLDNIRSSSVSMSDAYEQTTSLEKSESVFSGRNAAWNSQVTDMFIGYMQQDGMTQDQIAQRVNPKSAAGMRLQNEMVDKYWDRLVSDLGWNGEISGDGPKNNVPTMPSLQSFVPIDTSAANDQLQTPNVGNYQQSKESSERMYASNFDHAHENLESSNTKGKVNQLQNEIGKETERWTGDALLRRGAGLFDFSDPLQDKRYGDFSSSVENQLHQNILGESNYQSGPQQSKLSGTKEEFVGAIMPAAIEAAERTGVDPRIIVAQAALETGWGQSAPGNNFFGIKSHGQEGGQELTTTEVIDGKSVTVTDSFRRYENAAASVDGYANFLLNNQRYQPMMEAEGLEAQLVALGESGYATDPDYAEKVGQIARSLPSAKS